jgi:hypothetical protein
MFLLSLSCKHPAHVVAFAAALLLLPLLTMLLLLSLRLLTCRLLRRCRHQPPAGP